MYTYTYLQDPPADIKLSVTAEVEGRNLNHLAKFIEMQVRMYASLLVLRYLVCWYFGTYVAFAMVLYCTVLSLQIHRTIRRKHTLPSRKARFKPLLPSQIPHPRDTKVSY